MLERVRAIVVDCTVDEFVIVRVHACAGVVRDQNTRAIMRVLDLVILEPKVAGRARARRISNLDRVMIDVGRVNDKPLHDDVFLAGSVEIKNAVGTSVRQQGNGFARIGRYRDRGAPRRATRNGG